MLNRAAHLFLVNICVLYSYLRIIADMESNADKTLPLRLKTFAVINYLRPE